MNYTVLLKIFYHFSEPAILYNITRNALLHQRWNGTNTDSAVVSKNVILFALHPFIHFSGNHYVYDPTCNLWPTT